MYLEGMIRDVMASGRRRARLIRLTAGFLLLCCGLSCTGGRGGIHRTEEGEWTVYRLSRVLADFDRTTAGTYGEVTFGAEKRLSKTGDSTTYSLLTTTLVRDGLGVRIGDSLRLVIDNDTVSLRCAELVETRRGIRRGSPETGIALYDYEHVRFPATRELIRSIAFATSVTYTFFGTRKSLGGSLTEDNRSLFREFFRVYVL